MFKLLSLYNKGLQSKPLLITSISTGVCYGIGDYVAQTIEKNQNKREEYDMKRLMVFLTFGLTCGGPVYYAWFNKIHNMPQFIERVVKWNERRILTRHFQSELRNHINSNNLDVLSMKTFRNNYKTHFDTIEKPVIRSKTVLVAKIYADQFIFSVIYPVFFMMTTGVALDLTKSKEELTLNSFTNAFNKSWINVKNKFVQIYIADCAVWPLAQMANFAFIPAHLQPIFVNFMNIGWNTFLSYTSQGH
jgi:hypothetical protein